ncbi:MAG: FAD-dependent oxidoreductase, partial [Candidatus Omnitrophica bacterium]|nr:FAD-dependent oxidoreductase [Candidatus Omnitrophota bacterium]
MDVVIIGGGLSGVAAAVSAAKEGAKVALIERAGFLGGLATGGWVGPILGLTVPGTEEPAIEGFLKDLVERLHAKGGCPSFPECVKRHCVEFNAETLKLVLDEIVEENRINLYLDTVCIGAMVENDTIQGVEIYTRAGRMVLKGKVFVDATGDGELIFLSGAQYLFGRPEDGRVMAIGSFFRIVNVGPVSEKEKQKIKEAIEAEREAGMIAVYHGSIFGRGSFFDIDGYC